MQKAKKYSGFSLIEILIVVGLILILAAITIVAINPAKHFQDTRNAERSADVSELLNAVTQFTAEDGNLLSSLGAEEIPLCSSTEGFISIGTEFLDVTDTLVDDYIVEIPQNPSLGTPGNTGYTICQTEGGRVEIEAPHAEDTEIVVRR